MRTFDEILTKRLELAKCLKALKKGDTLIGPE